MGVLGMRFAALPDFVEQECAGCVNGAVQIVAQAAVLFSSRTNHAAQFRFEDGFLAFACAQQDDQRDGIFGKLRAPA